MKISAGEIIRRLRALLKRDETKTEPFSLNAAIEDVLRLMSKDLDNRGIAVACQMESELPHLTGDRVQLQQVVMNLLMNSADAVHALPANRRVVRLTTEKSAGIVRVILRDDGNGLPADPESLFAPFFTTKEEGLGMGLVICRSIITAHNGRIWAERTPGHGATFIFEVPISQATEAATL